MAGMTPQIFQRIKAGNISDGDLRSQGFTPKEISYWKALASTDDSVDALGESSRTASSGLTGLISTLDGATGGMSEFEKAAVSAGKSLIGGQFLGAINEIATAITKAIDRVEELRIGFNKLGVEDGRNLIRSLRTQQEALMGYGVSLETLTGITTNFRERLSALAGKDFPDQEKALTRIAAVNERFGIGVYESTQLLNQLDTSFQMGVKSADNFNASLLNFAKQTGQPFKKVFDDFSSSVRAFNVEMDPNKALQKFTVFQQMARRLGTEIGTLTDLTDKFETIEGGMEFGGQLNMLLSNLGGSFNAVEATLMSQPERMQYIANQVAEVGDKIRGMSDLGQRAILRQLSQTLGVDVGMIRSLINKDKGADIDRFLKGTTSLSAMTAEEQRRMANEMTTRAEIVQQTNDKMVGEIAIRGEELAQKGTRARQDMVRTVIDELGTRANEIIEALGEKLNEKRDVLLNTKIAVEVEAKDSITGDKLKATIVEALLKGG